MRDGNMSGQMLSVLIGDFSVFKLYKLCIGWSSKIVIKTMFAPEINVHYRQRFSSHVTEDMLYFHKKAKWLILYVRTYDALGVTD